MGERHTHLDLDLVHEGNAISGRLALAGGAPQEFTGYAGLIAALESIRETEPQQPGPRPREGDHR